MGPDKIELVKRKSATSKTQSGANDYAGRNTMNTVRTILRAIKREPGLTEAKFSIMVKKKGSKPDDVLFDATIRLEAASRQTWYDQIIGVMERSSG